MIVSMRECVRCLHTRAGELVSVNPPEKLVNADSMEGVRAALQPYDEPCSGSSASLHPQSSLEICKRESSRVSPPLACRLPCSMVSCTAPELNGAFVDTQRASAFVLLRLPPMYSRRRFDPAGSKGVTEWEAASEKMALRRHRRGS